MGITFCPADVKDFEGRMGPDRTHLETPAELSPLEVYVSLKSLYGEANREFIDEDKQQWVFLLKTEDAVVEIYDWKLDSWSIGVYEYNKDTKRAESIAKDLVTLLKRAITKQRAHIQSIARQVSGQIIENPFTLYYDTASELLELAQKFNQDIQTGPNMAGALADFNKGFTLCRSAFFQFVASIEGLLNLIYDLYLKLELREDRIVDRLSREQIDVKLRLAPVYCECFAGTAIDHTTNAFKNFHTLANLRNDFIHANLTKSMRTPVVRYEGAMYLIRASINTSDGSIPASLSSFGIEDLTRVKSAVDDIAAQLLASMKPRFRREFGAVMNDDHINVVYEDGIPIIVR